MKTCTAYVLGGGGSRGALQVGAMRALLEAGITPDLMVGSSIGAVNAAALGLWGPDLDGIDALEKAWREMAGKQILDPRTTQLMVRAMMGHFSDRSRQKVEEYFIAKGFSHDLCFHHIPWVRLGLVSADISCGQPVIYGQDPGDSVLEGLLASVALPPWFAPYQKDGQIMIDGGALSSVPIEPAMRLGATEIIALDLDDDSMLPKENLSFFQYLERYIFAVSKRHTTLEKQLAESQGIPVHMIDFTGMTVKPTWDFSHVDELIKVGYDKTSLILERWAHNHRLPQDYVLPIAEKQHI